MDLEKIASLKSLVRTGWMQRGIPPSIGETVADHSFEAAVLAYYLSVELRKKGVEVDPFKSSVLALFHDVGEAVIGDLPKWTTERLGLRKREIEAEAHRLLGTDTLFKEYKESGSLESKIAKISDRLSTLLQAYRYIRLGYDVKEIIESYEDELEKLLTDLPALREVVEGVKTHIKGSQMDK